jgi:diadenosine tetraphosphate (Ap4A) HIT family hydrolase
MNKNKNISCPFCQDDIYELSFLESENFYVIYNNAPILPGHSLVISKYHVESMFELNDSEITELVLLSIRASKLVLKVFNSESFDWTVQEKPEAGQTISHLHLHILPRKDKDLPSPGDWYPLLRQSEQGEYLDSEDRQKFTRQQIIEIVNHIKKYSEY